MRVRIEHREIIRALIGRTVELDVGVVSRLAPIRRDQIVHVAGGRAPVPQRKDDVALEPSRPVGFCERQLACSDAVGPVAPQRERPRSVEPPDHGDHLRHRLARCDAPSPRLGRGLEIRELLGHGARALGAERVARHAAARLDDVHPLGLGLHRPCGKLALRRDLEHRIPVDRRIVFRRRSRARRRRCGQIEGFPGGGPYLGRIDQSVTAHPHAVVGLRKLGDEVAAAVVRDHDLGEFGREIGRFRDHPDSGLETVRARDRAAEIARAGGRAGGRALRGTRRDLARRQ